MANYIIQKSNYSLVVFKSDWGERRSRGVGRTNQGSREQFNILLIEDCQEDTLLITKALEDTRFDIAIKVLEDGSDLTPYLERRRRNGSSEKPDLILLDWILTKVSGSEVLRQVKEDNRLRRVPVVVLTGSRSPDDVMTAYELGASAYLLKPTTFAETKKVLLALAEFYFGIVQLPREIEAEQRDLRDRGKNGRPSRTC